MNIFFLYKSPSTAAMAANDFHVRKMIIESAQLLSTVHNLRGSGVKGLYKPTHIHHPCTKWVNECVDNYHWLLDYFFQLSYEFSYRFEKIHATFEKLYAPLSIVPFSEKTKHIPTIPPIVTPPEPHEAESWDEVINAYRHYYANEKLRLAQWTRREPPIWMMDHNPNIIRIGNSKEINNKSVHISIYQTFENIR